ncbi:MAG: chromate transporter [Candidatus Faecousia sp.]|nr:chromate transporter [Candidatus Faecousia sp.]
MVLLELFWSFLLIGFSSFGGLSMIPQISDQVLSHGWMTAEQVTDIVAIAEMTPGPLGLNCATFAGMQAAGIPGAIAANLGALTPALTLCAVAAAFFNRFRESRIMQRILVGVRPACLGMVLAVLVNLAGSTYLKQGMPHYAAMGIGLLDLVLVVKCKVSIPVVILLSAGLGLLLFGVLGIPISW